MYMQGKYSVDMWKPASDCLTTRGLAPCPAISIQKEFTFGMLISLILLFARFSWWLPGEDPENIGGGHKQYTLSDRTGGANFFSVLYIRANRGCAPDAPPS